MFDKPQIKTPKKAVKGTLIEDSQTLVGDVCQKCNMPILHDPVRPEEKTCGCDGVETQARVDLAEKNGDISGITVQKVEVLNPTGPPTQIFG